MKSLKSLPQGIKPPVCPIKEHHMIAHGDLRSDPYYWLNDFWLKGPDSDHVIEYLNQENAYLDTMMHHTQTLQRALYHELKSRIKDEDESVPMYKNGYFYYTRTVEGTDYFLYCRKKAMLSAPEEILLDVNQMAKGFDYYSASGFSISPDNRFLLYAVDTVSRRQYDLYIKNLETGELLKDVIHNTEGYGVWANDNATFFYTSKHPVTLLSEEIKKHIIGTESDQDVIIYREMDQSNYISVERSKSGQYIFINSSSTLSSEVRYLSANDPQGTFILFQERMKEILYDVYHQQDQFLIITNLQAQNFKLMSCPLIHTQVNNWTEVIPHRADVLIEGIDVFRNFWVLTERKNGLVQLHVRNIIDQQDYHIEFDETTYDAGTFANAEYDYSLLRFNYNSLITPATVYDYHMVNKEKTIMKQQEVIGGYDKTEYISERHFVKVNDGTLVPISLVYKKGLEKNGHAPCLLYAYGSYGLSVDATFNSNRLSLLNRGFVYAIAHIRGGQEMGRHWYESGKMHHKMNTFTDFNDCAEYLINQQYTSTPHLYANGGSAGGLLMGAIVNLRPDLYNGIIADVPFVDVLTTMSDPTIPLTTNEYDEWGNPANEVDYFYMKKYAPYDNLKVQDYPHMLVTTGLHDSQVQYFEPAKWVAKIRTLKTDQNVLLLKTNMEAGHGGKSGRYKYLEEIALKYAFYLMLEGISE